MKKAMLLFLVAFLCFTKSLLAQIMVTFENNTPQYFGASLMDNTGAPLSGYFIDVVNNMTQVRYPYVQNGTLLMRTTDWRGIALRGVPTGTVSPNPTFFTGMPNTSTFTIGGVTYNLYCAILSPTMVYVRIDP